MNLDEAIDYANRIVKPSYEGNIFGRKDAPNPNWQSVRETMRPHVLGDFPSRLFALKRPTEADYWFLYRQENFEPITKAAANTAIVNERRIFLESNYTISYATGDNDTKEYVNREIFVGQKLTRWLFGRPHRVSKWDANAVIVPMPYRMNPEDGGLGTKIDVKFDLVGSDRIIDINEDLISWKCYSKALYIGSGGKQKEGKRFWVIDKENFWKIDQISDDERYSVELFYPHLTGAPLYQVLPGNPEERNGQIINRSHMEGYAPFANDALLDYSDFKVSCVLHNHPIPIIKPRECDYVNRDAGHKCDGGSLIRFTGELVEDSFCPKCKGSGEITAIHPGEAIVRSLPNSEADPAYYAKDIPPIEYIRPPVEGLDFQWKLVNEKIEMARQAINRKSSWTEASGESKREDKEDEYSQIQAVANQWFGDVLENVLYMVVKLRNPDKWRKLKPEVTPPTDFQLKTAIDLIEELKLVREANAPASVYLAKVSEYVNRAYANNRIQRLKVELALIIDHLQVHDVETQNLLLANGSAELKDLVLSLNISKIIDMKLLQDVNALDWSIIKWVAYIDAESSKITDAMTPTEPVIDPTTEPVIKPVA